MLPDGKLGGGCAFQYHPIYELPRNAQQSARLVFTASSVKNRLIFVSNILGKVFFISPYY